MEEWLREANDDEQQRLKASEEAENLWDVQRPARGSNAVRLTSSRASAKSTTTATSRKATTTTTTTTTRTTRTTTTTRTSGARRKSSFV